MAVLPSILDLLDNSANLNLQPKVTPPKVISPPITAPPAPIQQQELNKAFNVNPDGAVNDAVRGFLQGEATLANLLLTDPKQAGSTIGKGLKGAANEANKLWERYIYNAPISGAKQIPLVGGTLSTVFKYLMPESIYQAPLYVTPTTRAEALGESFLSALAKNALRFTGVNTAINTAYNTVEGKNLLHNLPEAVAEGAAIGAGGTLIPKGLAYAGKGARYLADKLGQEFTEELADNFPALKGITSSISNTVRATIGKYLSPDTALRTYGINNAVMKYNSIQGVAQALSAQYDNLIKEYEPVLNTIAGVIKTDKTSPNAINAMAGITMMKKKEFTDFTKKLAKLEGLESIPEGTYEKTIELYENIMKLKKPLKSIEKIYKRNFVSSFLRQVDKTYGKQTAKDYYIPFEKYLSFAPNAASSALARNVNTWQENMLRVGDRENLVKAFENSIVYPIYHDTIDKIGTILSKHHIEPDEAQLIAHKIIDNVQPAVGKEISIDRLGDLIRNFPKATNNIGYIYKAFKNLMVEHNADPTIATRTALSIVRRLYAPMGRMPTDPQIKNAEAIAKVVSEAEKELSNQPERFNKFLRIVLSDTIKDPKNLKTKDLFEKYLNSKEPLDIPTSHYFLVGTRKYASPYKTLEPHFNPSAVAGNGFVTANNALKRVLLSFSPFHFRSLLFSHLYATGDGQKFIEDIHNIFSKPKEFDAYMKPKLAELTQMLSDIPGAPVIVGATTDVRRDKRLFKDTDSPLTKLFKSSLGKAYDSLDKKLWDRLYTSAKVNSYLDVYAKYKANTITLDAARKELDNVNTFFGGIPQLHLLNPAVLNTLRLILLAPDWELSLLKQFGNAVTLKDEQSIRYYYNLLAFNFFLNSTWSAARGNQPLSTSPTGTATAIAGGDINQLFHQLLSLGGYPTQVSTLGYEEEMPKMLHDAIELPLSAISQNKDVGMAFKALLGDFRYKLSPFLGVYTSLDEIRQGSPYGGSDLLSSFLPFIAGSLTGQNKNLEQSAINSVGLRAYTKDKTSSLAQMFYGNPNVTPQAYEKIFNDIRNYYSNVEAATGKPAFKSYMQNLINNIIKGTNPDILQAVSNKLYQASIHPDKADEYTAQAAKIQQDYINSLAVKMYNSWLRKNNYISDDDVQGMLEQTIKYMDNITSRLVSEKAHQKSGFSAPATTQQQ